MKALKGHQKAKHVLVCTTCVLIYKCLLHFIAYDHFGIFYCHMPSQETCELCLIAGTNMEDLIQV